MNKAFFLRKEDQKPKWRLIDAEGKIVGRLATEIARALRGKDKAQFTPHSDAGDYIVVINAEKVVFTGNKREQKEYARYTGYMGGLKTLTAQQLLDKKPEKVIEFAVKGMLPKESSLARKMFKKLKVYKGNEHPHKAQISS
jgi:large subunit ribosomal protein L13